MVKQEIERKIRNDYAGILSEVQIQATIDWWNALTDKLSKEADVYLECAQHYFYEYLDENILRSKLLAELEAANKRNYSEQATVCDIMAKPNDYLERWVKGAIQQLVDQREKIDALEKERDEWKRKYEHYFTEIDADRVAEIAELKARVEYLNAFLPTAATFDEQDKEILKLTQSNDAMCLIIASAILWIERCPDDGLTRQKADLLSRARAAIQKEGE